MENDRRPRPIRAIVPIVITAVLTAVIVGGGVLVWQKSVQREMVERVRTEAAENARAEVAEDARATAAAEACREYAGLISELEYRVRIAEHLRKIYGDGERHFFEVFDLNTERNPSLQEIAFWVAVSDDLPVIVKMKILAEKLSKYRFGYNPIKVSRIDEHKGKKIAVIELVDKGLLPGDYSPWDSLYFSGSTGGGRTTIALVETFLQDAYKGEWVDGVQFYYAGKPIECGIYDHVGLCGIIYRDGTRECEYE